MGGFFAHGVAVPPLAPILHTSGWPTSGCLILILILLIDLIGQSVGLRYNLFFNGPAFTDSFILQTEVGMMRIDATNLTKFENNDLSGITKKSSFYGNLGVGYGWFWSLFSIAMFPALLPRAIS